MACDMDSIACGWQQATILIESRHVSALELVESGVEKTLLLEGMFVVLRKAIGLRRRAVARPFFYDSLR
jgi:hypothetical protein